MKAGVQAGVILGIIVLTAPLWAYNDFQGTEEFFVKKLKVILKPNPANEIVSAQLYWRGGSLNLTEENQGIERLIFSTATLKNRKYAEESWQRLLEGTGAEIGSASLRNYTIISLRCTREHFEPLWEVFSDYVRNTGFYDERVEVIRERFLTEYGRREDSPDVYIRDVAAQQFYENHPYRFDPAGAKESLERISMREMASYLDDGLTQSRLLLVVVGNIDRELLEKKLSKTLAKLPGGKRRPQTIPVVEHAAPKLKIIERDLPTNYLLGLFSAPGPTHPDYFAMTVAIDILKARLFEEIRTKRNLSYAPDAFLSTDYAGHGGVYATSVDPDSTVKIMVAEMEKLKSETISDTDLRNRARLYITKKYLNIESNTAQGQFLAHFELSGLGWQASAKLVESIQTVTPADVQRVAQQYFKNLQFVVLGNPELVDQELFTY